MLRFHRSPLENFSGFTSSSDRIPRSSYLVTPLSAEVVGRISHLSSRPRVFRGLLCSRRVLPLQYCKALWGDRGRVPRGDDGQSDQFLEAVLLVSETVMHYNMWKNGFAEEGKGNYPQFPVNSFPYQVKEPMPNVNPISRDFLRQFRNPTIFLKILCHGDLLLPIAVGDLAITRFIDDSMDDQYEQCPDQFQCLEDIMGTFGYEVKMVGITKRVMNTYFAQIFVGKPAERANTSVDARPSDALSVAKRFKMVDVNFIFSDADTFIMIAFFRASIFVSKEIVLKDAIKIVHGTWSRRRSKNFYDVYLDSAPEGPDPVSEELDLIRKMNIAAMEERYQDAAILRDMLWKLRMPKPEI